MDKGEMTKAFLAAVERGDVNDTSFYLAEDVVCTGMAPCPVGKDSFQRIMRALVAGIPNWQFNADNWQARGETISTDVRVTGVQSENLPAVLWTVPPVLATGRHIALPAEHIELTWRGDKIVYIDVERVEGGGVLGVLQQLGIMAPFAAA